MSRTQQPSVFVHLFGQQFLFLRLVMLVFDVAKNDLNQILDRDNAFCAAKLVHHHQELKIGDRVWRLHLPEPRDTTLTSEHDPGDPSEPSLRVHFLVSRDEESVSLTVVTPAGEHRWEPRAPHYLLLTLARQRLAETQLAEHERGWLDVDRLARMLNLNRKTVNVYICRLRAQLADAGVPGGATLIQRRLLSQQIRIGVGLLEILHG